MSVSARPARIVGPARFTIALARMTRNMAVVRPTIATGRDIRGRVTAPRYMARVIIISSFQSLRLAEEVLRQRSREYARARVGEGRLDPSPSAGEPMP